MIKICSINLLLCFVVLTACETKTTKEEPIAICGNALDPSFNTPSLISDNCFSCHAINEKVLGASFNKISKRNLPKERVFKLLQDPSEFNDTNEIPHTRFEFLSEKEMLEIYNWLDSLKYY